MLRSLFVTTTLFISGAAFAQSEATQALDLVITPTRTPTPIQKVGSSVTVITAEEIENSHLHSAAEILKYVPGVDIASSGGFGQIGRLFLRGADSNHVLVIIDGVEVNDPSSPDTAFDFANLNLDNIERIEVLRGPQGTLYGSEAIGGVINITTKKGEGRPTVSALAEGGSHHHYKGQLASSGEVGRFDYSASVSRTDRRGFSSVASGTEDDGYENTTVSSRLGVAVNENLSASAAFRYADSDVEYDDSFPLQDARNLGKSEEWSGRAALNTSFFDGRVKQEISASRGHIDRENRDSFPRTSEGTRTKFDWLNHLAVNHANLVTIGFETEESEYESADLFSTSKHSVRNNAAFLQDQVSIGDAFSASAGVRIDDHDEFGNEVTWRVAPSYLIEATRTRFKASYGTGFKAPSLFELYDGFFGNRNLKPEKSHGVDFGVEQELVDGKLALGATAFYSKIDDLIESHPVTFAAVNVGEATSRGVEFTGSFRPVKAVQVGANYTFTDAEDDTTGQRLIRRARHKGNVYANYAFDEQARAGISIDHVGDREDSVFPGRVTLDQYTTVNLNGSVDVSDHVNAYARVNNLLDEDYQEVFGYETGGVEAFGGLKVKF